VAHNASDISQQDSKTTRTWMTCTRLGLFAFLLDLMLAGCGSHSETSQQLVVLHVADQLKTLQSTLAAAGEDTPSSYRIEWSNFLGGPNIIAAATGRSIDVGWMAETPLVFAQAAGSPVKVIAAASRVDPRTSNIAIVVANDSPIHSVAELRGKKVSFLPGTITQYLVVRAIEQAGLKLSDIQQVTLTSMSPSVLTGGTTDAITTADPMLSQMLRNGQARILVAGGAPLTTDFSYLVAANGALDDPRLSAAIGDFTVRLARAIRWQREHLPDAIKTYAQIYQVPPEVAEDALKRAPSRFGPIGSFVIDGQQAESDTFERLGLIRSHMDAAKLFDHRYDEQIAKVEAAP